jgi:hypothetical protein
MMQQLVSREVPLNKVRNNLAKTTYANAFPFDRSFLFVFRAIARMRNDRLSFSIRLFIPTLGLFVTKARPDLATLLLSSLLRFSDQDGSSFSPHIHRSQNIPT